MQNIPFDEPPSERRVHYINLICQLIATMRMPRKLFTTLSLSSGYLAPWQAICICIFVRYQTVRLFEGNIVRFVYNTLLLVLVVNAPCRILMSNIATMANNYVILYFSLMMRLYLNSK